MELNTKSKTKEMHTYTETSPSLFVGLETNPSTSLGSTAEPETEPETTLEG